SCARPRQNGEKVMSASPPVVSSEVTVSRKTLVAHSHLLSVCRESRFFIALFLDAMPAALERRMFHVERPAIPNPLASFPQRTKPPFASECGVIVFHVERRAKVSLRR